MEYSPDYRPELPHLSKVGLVALLEEVQSITPLTMAALEQAERSHHSQERDSGNPYLDEHIYPVTAEIVYAYEPSVPPETEIIGALLHDAIEDDSRFTYQDCVRQFGGEVADIVQALTKTIGENVPGLSEIEKQEINKIYVRRIAKSSPSALMIKLADRYNNLQSVESLQSTQPERFDRYMEETETLFLPFALSISPHLFIRLSETLAEYKTRYQAPIIVCTDDASECTSVQLD